MKEQYLAELKELHDNPPKSSQDLLLDAAIEQAREREVANAYWFEVREHLMVPAFDSATNALRAQGWDCTPELKEPYGGQLSGTLTIRHQSNGRTIEVKMLGSRNSTNSGSYKVLFGGQEGLYSDYTSEVLGLTAEDIETKLIKMALFLAKRPER